MFYDLSAGDVLHIGDAVTLTVLAIEGDQICLAVDSPGGECADPQAESRRADRMIYGWWQQN